MLDRSEFSPERRWKLVLRALDVPVEAGAEIHPERTVRLLTSEYVNRSSIVSCIASARENAQQVREQISSEMWEQLNRLFLELRRGGSVVLQAHPHEFLASVKEGAHLFQGITDSTMNHGEGWQFIQAGRYIERAGAIAMLTGVHFNEFPCEPDRLPEGSEYLEWIGLLKCATAFESYCKVYTADPRPERIAEFLLLNAEFPHSLRFSVDMLHAALQKISLGLATRKTERLSRLTGRLRATLNFSHIDEIVGPGLHQYLDTIQRQAHQIHSAIYQVYVGYTVESALEA
jgi:uncharacterized alpha-E superfamily protein